MQLLLPPLHPTFPLTPLQSLHNHIHCLRTPVKSAPSKPFHSVHSVSAATVLKMNADRPARGGGFAASCWRREVYGDSGIKLAGSLGAARRTRGPESSAGGFGFLGETTSRRSLKMFARRSPRTRPLPARRERKQARRGPRRPPLLERSVIVMNDGGPFTPLPSSWFTACSGAMRSLSLHCHFSCSFNPSGCEITNT